MIYFALDYRILNKVHSLADDYTYQGDNDNMPLAPHRYKMPDYSNSVWLFHRTKTNMSDFISFVEKESTQVIEEHNFYLNNDQIKRSQKDDNLIAQEDFVSFKPGETYDRTIVRKFLSEYYSKRARWSQNFPHNRDDTSRYYFLAKGVKDYILATGKLQFKYEEIYEIIESMSILCYTNDIMTYYLIDFVNYLDTYNCDYRYSECFRNKSEPIAWKRYTRFHLMEPCWVTVVEFMTKSTTSSLHEKLLIFDEWEENFPIITPERVNTPIEATVEFFSVPLERRNCRLNYTEQFNNQSEVYINKLKRSPWDLVYEFWKHDLFTESRLVPRFFEQPNIARGFHISVKEITNPDVPLGHDNYSYRKKEKQLLWVRFEKSWS